MALAASCLFRLESLLAIMAGTAGLAGVNISHCDLDSALFHGKELGVGVAISAFETLFCMSLAIEHHLSLAAPGKFNSFP